MDGLKIKSCPRNRKPTRLDALAGTSTRQQNTTAKHGSADRNECHSGSTLLFCLVSSTPSDETCFDLAAPRMQKVIKLGTSVNEAVSAVEAALENGSVTLQGKGTAISKTITIAEIVKRKASADSITQENRLCRAPIMDQKAVDGEEGEFKAVESSLRDKFLPCLEITLTRKVA